MLDNNKHRPAGCRGCCSVPHRVAGMDERAAAVEQQHKQPARTKHRRSQVSCVLLLLCVFPSRHNGLVGCFRGVLGTVNASNKRGFPGGEGIVCCGVLRAVCTLTIDELCCVSGLW